MGRRQPLAVRVEPEQIIQAVKSMGAREREEFVEDLLAATSPKYLASIRKAREDARKGRLKDHKDLFPA